MKLKQRKKSKLLRECSGCRKKTDTRTLNIRYQDFVKTYATSNYNPNRSHFWFYNTIGYDLCKLCQGRFLKKLSSI